MIPIGSFFPIFEFFKRRTYGKSLISRHLRNTVLLKIKTITNKNISTKGSLVNGTI